MKSRELRELKGLEEKLKSASPSDSAKLTKQLVKLKDDWLHKP